jgi:hypothetical protein
VGRCREDGQLRIVTLSLSTIGQVRNKQEIWSQKFSRKNFGQNLECNEPKSSVCTVNTDPTSPHPLAPSEYVGRYVRGKRRREVCSCAIQW